MIERIEFSLNSKRKEEDMFEKIKELCRLDPSLIVGAVLAAGAWIVIGSLHLRDYLADRKRWRG